MRRLTIAACALIGGLYCQGQPKDSAPAPAQSAPKTTTAASTTPTRRISVKKDGLKQLEEDLFKSMEPAGPPDPLESGQMMLPPRPVERPLSRKAQMLEEQRKNWAFMTPEQLMGVPGPDDLLNGTDSGRDGNETKPLSLLEQYYQRQEHPNKAVKKADQSDPFSLADKRANSDDSPFSGGDRSGGNGKRDRSVNSKQGENLGEMDFATGPHLDSGIDKGFDTGLFRHPSTISDVFGLGHSEPTPEELLAHKARIEEFRRLLNTDWHSPSDNLLPAATGKDAAPASGLGGLPLAMRADDPNAASLGIATLIGGMTDPAQNLNAPTAPGTASTLPKAPAPSLTPPNPTFLAPRRQF
jgi:hypothetical protein